MSYIKCGCGYCLDEPTFRGYIQGYIECEKCEEKFEFQDGDRVDALCELEERISRLEKSTAGLERRI